MNKKIIIGVAILILAIAAGGFWYVKIQKEEIITKPKEKVVVEEENSDEIDASNWKTYRNEEYGFEVKYPSNWVFVEESEKIKFSEEGKEYFIEEGKAYPISLSFNFDKYEEKKTIEEWADGKMKKSLGEQSINELTIGGKPAITVKTYMGIETVILYDENNNQIFLVTPNFGNDTINNENLLVYNTMIKTIRFY